MGMAGLERCRYDRPAGGGALISRLPGFRVGIINLIDMHIGAGVVSRSFREARMRTALAGLSLV